MIRRPLPRIIGSLISRLGLYLLAAFSLLLTASALACVPTPPGVDADSTNPAPVQHVRSAWGACAWRTDKLPVPTVSSEFDNGVWTITGVVADTGTKQAESILIYSFGPGIPASIDEIPLQDGAGTGSVTVSAGSDVNIHFDARAIRRNAVNLSVCSYDIGQPIEPGFGQPHRVCASNGFYGRPHDVRVSNITPTSATVHWTNSNEIPFENRLWLFRFFGGQVPRVVQTVWVEGQPGENVFVIDGLESGEQYRVSVSLHWHDALGIRCSPGSRTETFTTPQR